MLDFLIKNKVGPTNLGKKNRAQSLGYTHVTVGLPDCWTARCLDFSRTMWNYHASSCGLPAATCHQYGSKRHALATSSLKAITTNHWKFHWDLPLSFVSSGCALSLQSVPCLVGVSTKSLPSQVLTPHSTWNENNKQVVFSRQSAVRKSNHRENHKRIGSSSKP